MPCQLGMLCASRAQPAGHALRACPAGCERARPALAGAGSEGNFGLRRALLHWPRRFPPGTIPPARTAGLRPGYAERVNLRSHTQGRSLEPLRTCLQLRTPFGMASTRRACPEGTRLYQGHPWYLATSSPKGAYALACAWPPLLPLPAGRWASVRRRDDTSEASVRS